ncbi:Asp-tRNA(Asn)/Glu-tRNA(Gln) amidotransferase subunit GatA, partial [bacterium]|nr:Asp-tRNA(Asn)/Glu-tRNA(Gln) amidotransferase subunit GatA [bacterium]
MNKLNFASIEVLIEKIQNKEISSRELVEHSAKRFQAHNSKLNASLEIFDTDSILKNVKDGGALHGIPGVLKDVICQNGRKLTCGSKVLEGLHSTYDATATSRLKLASAPIMGRANCDEFAMGSSTETSAFGPTFNPWDTSRVPGGSSGGSAAAVAAGLVPWALGSETGGSVRQPAAFCGIVGLKPTYGLVSRYGLVAFTSSFDQIGPLTRTVKGNAHILSAIAGNDPNDSTSLNVEPKDYTAQLNGSIKPGLRIGVIQNAMQADGVDPEIIAATEESIKQFEKLGAKIENVQLPAMEYGAAVYFILARAQAASNLARFDGVRYGLRAQTDTLQQMYEQTRDQGFGSNVKARILTGNYVLSSGFADKYYDNARRVRQMMRQEFVDTFKQFDLLLCPVTPEPAFKVGAYDNNKLAMDLQDYFTCASNITGTPAISVPCGMTSQGLPIGVQLLGPDLSEELLLQTAYAYEQATP